MTAQEYLISTLQKMSQPLPQEDLAERKLEDVIFAKIMSKKFRKLKADETTTTITKNAIHTAITNKQPITISFLFGGNKLWRFEEAPEIDWAELFAVSYYVEWMKSIASVYPHGVRLDFYSEDVAVETLNNVTLKETEQYSQTFRAMLEWLKPYIPKGITITYRRYAEEYDTYEDYLQELAVAKEKHLKNNGGKLPELSEIQKAATELNVRLLPKQAEDPLWREKVELTHRSLEETATLTRYLEDPIIIRACPTSYSGWIAVGSTKRSLAKFWAAIGVLQPFKNDFVELVLTPKQLPSAEFDWQDINLEGLKWKNFSRIRVLKNPL